MSVRRPAHTLRAPGALGHGSDEAIRFNRSQEQGTGTIMPDNAFIEAFNARLSSECLNASWFLSMADALTRIGLWRGDYTTTVCTQAWET